MDVLGENEARLWGLESSKKEEICIHSKLSVVGCFNGHINKEVKGSSVCL